MVLPKLQDIVASHHRRLVHIRDENLHFNGVHKSIGVLYGELHLLRGGSFVVQIYPGSQPNLSCPDVDGIWPSLLDLDFVSQGVVVQIRR